ncbi:MULTISPECIES: cation diffusion facilitator family transporter [Brachybacterium]|uniref:Cation transporter n=1 Tax=Brachybacterium alimentarium TaxID=47845 RepID=A0A2A3YHQ5_9MICO|nr:MULTISPECIES: cation diffusion facilitator family transporter [Brachybacterium]PCC34850.1 cation transporter [Brachybacterium alimentarium]PCC38635.1 cation transporter [Brachybacterium alimentarium]RCS62356.1 cation transporter [Brachybacterium sp. JB7]RCS68989.1 cation transporter [Brachybacterium alimentarium]RCS80505.1 cation transporter [Brachybacterium alimentarium]
MTHGHGSVPAAGHAGAAHRWRLAVAVALIGVFFVVELIAGLLSGSLALISDAGHMAADVVTLAAALSATVLAARPDRSGRRTFGNYRLEVFASLLAVLIMLGVALFVVIGGIGRIGSAVEIDTGPMLVVGVLGLIVNLIVLRMLQGGAGESLNVKGAYLEVLADTVGSVGVVVAALLIRWTGATWIDTAVALAVGAFIAVRAVILAKEVLGVLGQSAPRDIDPSRVQSELEEIDGVADVHDLHLWTLTSGMEVATVHLVVAPGVDPHPVLDAAQELLESRHGIAHATVQTEPTDHHGCLEIGW